MPSREPIDTTRAHRALDGPRAPGAARSGRLAALASPDSHDRRLPIHCQVEAEGGLAQLVLVLARMIGECDPIIGAETTVVAQPHETLDQRSGPMGCPHSWHAGNVQTAGVFGSVGLASGSQVAQLRHLEDNSSDRNVQTEDSVGRPCSGFSVAVMIRFERTRWRHADVICLIGP